MTCLICPDGRSSRFCQRGRRKGTKPQEISTSPKLSGGRIGLWRSAEREPLLDR